MFGVITFQHTSNKAKARHAWMPEIKYEMCQCLDYLAFCNCKKESEVEVET